MLVVTTVSAVAPVAIKLQGYSLRFQEWSHRAELTRGMDFMAVWMKRTCIAVDS